MRAGLDAAGLWAELETDWLVLDCELLPWSAKAEALLRQQYAAVGSSGQATLGAEDQLLRAAQGRGLDVDDLLASTERRLDDVRRFVAAYRRYCWTVELPSTISSWRRSRSWQGRGRSSPSGITCGTSRCSVASSRRMTRRFA